MVFICGPKDYPKSINGFIINTTSKSESWSKGLSPFFLGPCQLYDFFVSKNVENAWQFSKVYNGYVDENGSPNENYWTWAKEGWNSKFAFRYPMGKNIKPLYSYWDGQKLDYIEARKKIYIPLYQKAVQNSEAWFELLKIYKANKDIWLFDFDGYNHRLLNMTWNDVMNNPNRKMGHAFVLGMMLEGFLKV